MKIKDEMRRLERDVLNIEARESEKASRIGHTLPTDSSSTKGYCYSSLQGNLREEFKSATWVVLTNPMVQK